MSFTPFLRNSGALSQTDAALGSEPSLAWLDDDLTVKAGNASAPAASALAAPVRAATSPEYQTVTVFNGGVTFNLEFVTSQNPTSAFETEVENAARLLSAAITDNITVNIVVGYGYYGDDSTSPLTGGLSEGGDWSYGSFSYTEVRQALLDHAALGDRNFASLPTGSSISGQSSFDLSSAEEKSLGFLSPTDDGIDGEVGFAAGIPASEMVGVALHEITHALGRVNDDVFDFFRYTSDGVRSFSTAMPAPLTYFSLDGGATALAYYGETSDPSDFENYGAPGETLTTNDPFNEYYSSTTTQNLTAVDLTQLDVLGFNTVQNAPVKRTALDFNDDGASDILLGLPSGQMTIWLMSDTTHFGTGTIANPGIGWREIAAGDLNSDGTADLLYQRSDGALLYQFVTDVVSNGDDDIYVSGSGTVAGPGSDWSFVALGYFAGGSTEQLLFRDSAGALAIWGLSGGALVAEGSLGSPGAAWAVRGVGDFNGDGTSDILFENVSTGVYATWTLSGDKLSGGSTLGAPGAGWVFRGVGDFNRDGTTDILFENVDTGYYDTWQISGDRAAGGGQIGTPGAGWTLRGIGDYYGAGSNSLLFENAAGQLVSWDVDDTSVVGGAGVGAIGAADTIPDGVTLAIPLPPSLTFQDGAGGALAAWGMNGLAISSGAVFGAPGASWTALAKADFNGDGEPDLLLRDAGGDLAVWETNGARVIGGGIIGNPGSAWAYVGVGDFNGDGSSDLLFFDSASGQYATWDLHGASIVGGGVIGAPEGSWQEVAIGDFNGDGRSDLLFRDSAGDLAIWDLNDAAIVGGGLIGNPGSGWTLLGTGDFNGDGRSDLLFENASGTLATWELSTTTVVGGGVLGTLAAGQSFAGVADLNGDGKSDIVLQTTGGTALSAWIVNGASVVAQGAIADPGAGWRLIG